MVVRLPRRALLLALVVPALLMVTGCGPSQQERELRDSNQQLELQVSGLQNDLTAAQKARERALTDLAKAQQERDAARKGLADAEAQAAMLSDDRDQVVQQLQAAKGAIDTLTKQRDAAQSALDQANAALAQARAGAAAPAVAPPQASEAYAKASLDAANARANAAEGEAVRLRTQLQKAESDLVKASDDLGVMTQARDELQKVRNGLEAQVVDQANALAAAKQQEQALGTRVTQLEGQVADLEAKIDGATHALAQVQARAAEGASALAAAHKERDVLQGQLAAARHERDVLQARLDAAQQRSTTLAEQLQQTAGDLSNARGRATELTRSLETLLASHQGLQQLTEAQRSELASVRRRLEDAQNEVARLTGARGIYTVQPGDSLSSIAVFFYRDGNLWPAILRANAHLIDDADLIFPGMVLIVPEIAGAGGT